MTDKLEMLTQREQLMEDIDCIIEANFGEVEYKDDKRYLTDPAYAELVKVVKTEAPVEVDEKVLKIQETAKQKKNAGPLSPLVDMIPENLIVSLQNPKLMLQVIFFAIFFLFLCNPFFIF